MIDMWRKVIITAVFLVCSLSISYLININDIKSTLYAQTAPVFELPKGAKVVLGKYNNKELVWDIGNNNNNGNYVLMSSKPIVDSIQTFSNFYPTTNTPQSGADRENYCLRETVNPVTESMTTFCPVTPLINEINNINLNAVESNVMNQVPFLPSTTEVYSGGSLGLSVNDRAYRSDISYWLKGYLLLPEYTFKNYGNFYFNAKQLPLNQSVITGRPKDVDTNLLLSLDERITNGVSGNWVGSNTIGIINRFAIRPYSTVDKSKIMFAANTSYTDGSWRSYTVDTSNLNANNELNPEVILKAGQMIIR